MTKLTKILNLSILPIFIALILFSVMSGGGYGSCYGNESPFFVNGGTSNAGISVAESANSGAPVPYSTAFPDSENVGNADPRYVAAVQETGREYAGGSNASVDDSHRVSTQPARERLPQSTGEKTTTASGTAPRFFVGLFKIILSLGLVIGLFLGFAWFLKKFSPNLGRGLPPDVITVLGQTMLTSKHRLFLVRFGSKILLLSVSSDQVETLAELTDPGEVQTILTQWGSLAKETALPVGNRSEGLLSRILSGKEESR